MCEGPSTISGPIPPHPMFAAENALVASSRSSVAGDGLCEGPSHLSGPIASHYDSTSQRVDYSTAPRVRGSGKSNFDSHKKGNGVAMLIQLQGRSIIPQSFKFREPSKNHMATNMVKIKQLMRKVKEREAQKEVENTPTPVKALWKSEKYKDVPSKLKLDMSQVTPDTPRESNRSYLRAHSATIGLGRPRPQSARQAQQTKDPADPTNVAAISTSARSKDDIDFIRHNQNVARQARMRRAPSVEMLKHVQEKLNADLEKYQSKVKGKVPQYLEQRKEEIRKNEDEFKKSLPDPDQPPGHRKVPEDERNATLKLLQDTHQKLMTELNSLPIRTDTLKLQSTKTDIEKRLVQLDEAIKIFSKPKVFIKI